MARFPYVDYIVRNEGEVTLPLLIEKLSSAEDPGALLGITYRRGGKVVTNPDAPLIADLDLIPFPAYDLAPPLGGTVEVEVGRGCPFNCTFCSTSTFFRRAYRLKSTRRILEELRFLRDNYHVNSVSFTHDMFTANKKRVREICHEMLAADLKLDWTCSARVDCVTPELLETMQRAGCRGIFFGIETGSPRMQRLVNKRLKLDLVNPILRSCRDLGIKSTASFIVGFPDETQEDIELSLRKALDCICAGAQETQLHLCSPQPGTPLTLDNQDRLTFTGNTGDFASTNAPLDERCQALVRSMPLVFSAQYDLIPRNVSPSLLRGLDTFGLGLGPLCHTLNTIIASDRASTLLDLFRPVQHLIEPFHSWQDADMRARGAVRAIAGHIAGRLWQYGAHGEVIREVLQYDLARFFLGMAKGTSPLGSKATIADVAALPFPHDPIPYFRSPAVLAAFRSDPNQIPRWAARSDQRPPPFGATARFVAMCLRKIAADFDVVEAVPLTDAAKAIALRIDGVASLLEIAEDVWANSRGVWVESSDRAISLTKRVLQRLASAGMIGWAQDHDTVHSMPRHAFAGLVRLDQGWSPILSMIGGRPSAGQVDAIAEMAGWRIGADRTPELL